MISSFFVTLASFFFLSPLFLVPADATSGDLLSGYAWSPNTGWMSFNCTTTGNCGTGAGQSDYGVTVGSGASTRQLSGYAWSSNIGWITFNAADMVNSEPNCGTAGYPPCAPTATINVTSGTSYGQVSGWARACNVYQTGCSGAIKSDDLLGGWRGWIKLRGSSYGVLANGTRWTGYAWGGGPTTGTPSPLTGGNAVTGWISFRGVDTSVTPQIYGINATGDAALTRIISCGSDKGIISSGGTVQWSTVIDATKVAGPYTYVWGGNDGPTGSTNPINRTYTASSPNPKTAWVTVTAGGIPYFVDCDAVAVSGSPAPWYPSVTIGVYDLSADQPANPVGAEQGVPIIINGTFDNLGQAIPPSVPFTVRFEFETTGDSTADQWSASVVISGAAATTNNIPFSALWTPGTQGSTYRIRMCVDITDAVDEGSAEGNNCTSWSATTFTVGPPPTPPIDISGASCKGTPGVTQTNRDVVWAATGIAGGTGTYTYDWTFPGGTPGSCTNCGSPSTPTVYNTIGTKTASVIVHSTGVPDAPISCTGVVVRVQKFEEF